ncbi:NB-ARC domain protein [Nocardiopsis sp. L17-MgMaSL7]|uniref:NB-ARC domain protein n=1 Tax=Nocardiopsis sp. L17-MgMaSL7 TaxID=1938893 RepID=UPI000D71ACC7|nr:NB-ARC domain protein [Nocardiopsis sp. L17-MgMaSL7]PWV55255.1 hypothetical protein BDW27_103259 [Nocardiopsis sp. L17-MgMaSL7]
MPDHHRNDLSGHADAVVQARSIGSVHFGEPRPPAPPHQAPSADRRFTNRVDDLVRLDALAAEVRRERRGALALLLGESGIGKSVTLAEASARLSDRFEDGVLYRDLDTWRDREGNLDLTGVLRGLLQDLHVRDVDAESDVNVLIGRLRGVTAGKHLLLLLDGAASDTEIDHFSLGSGPHLVVAACEEGFAGAAARIARGAEALTLRSLAEADSLRLFRSFHAVDRRMSHRDEYEAATRLVRLCGGLPSAIRMAAGHVDAQGLSIAALVDAVVARQRSAVPPLAGVDAVIDVALSGLGADELRLLEFLSAHPGRSFPDELGHAAVGERAPAVMGRLADASLLHPETGAGRGIVELVRERVREGTGERWRFDAAAVLRFFTVTHHLADRASLGERHRLVNSLDTAELTVAPADHRLPFSRRSEAADWQDRHLAHVPDLMRLAHELDNPVAVLVLADAVWPACHGRRRLEIGTRVYGHALDVARQSGHRGAVARCAVYLARIHCELGQGERAAALVAEAARAAEGAEPDLAVVLETQGLLTGRFPELEGRAGPGSEQSPEELLTRSRDIHRRAGRPRGDALQTYQLGEQARRRGDASLAESELREAERIADHRLAELSRDRGERETDWAIHDWELLRARVRLALARALTDLNRLDEAEARADAARIVFEELAEPVKQVQAARILAGVAERRGERAQARTRLAWALRITEYYHLDGVAGLISGDLQRLTTARD